MTSLLVNHPHIRAELHVGKIVVHKKATSFQQWPSINVMSRIMVPSKYQLDAQKPWHCGSPRSGKIGCSIWRGSGGRRTSNQTKHRGSSLWRQHGMPSAFLKDVQPHTCYSRCGVCWRNANDLLVLDTKDIMESLAGTVMKVKTIGNDQYTASLSMNFCQSVWWLSPIHYLLNNRPLFSHPTLEGPSKGSLQLLSMKSDCNLFLRLYLASQTRYGDVNKFFCHESHSCPSAMSVTGMQTAARVKCRSILPYFEVETAASEESPPVDAQFLDAAVVQMLNPGTAKTFLDYAVRVFFHYRPCLCTRKAQLALTLFGMYIKQIEKRWAKVCGDQLLPLYWF